MHGCAVIILRWVNINAYWLILIEDVWYLYMNIGTTDAGLKWKGIFWDDLIPS